MGNLSVQLSASARARASLKRRTSRQRPRRSRPSCSKSRTFAALVTASATPPVSGAMRELFGTIPPPLGVAACRACHAPDAAMFPLGGRRASRAPARDHSRPIPPTSCRDAQRLAPANPRPPRSRLPTPPRSSTQPRAHPAPTAPTESPAPKDRPRRKLTPARASHSAGSMQHPRRHKLTPPRAAILPALCDAVSPPLQPPLPGVPLPPTPGPSAVPAALAV